ncbi:MAG: alpha/beta hydrolase [Halioglobus sp.]
MLKSLLSFTLKFLAAIALLLVIGAATLLWLNRDLPFAELEQRYGGNDLKRLDVDGVNLAYKVEGDGPPVLLLHSHFYTMRMWQPWVDVLKQEFTVVRMDLTSHGLTGPDPTGDYSRARGTQLINALLAHLDIERTALVGSSTGGALAWYFAAEEPQKVSKLILVNAPGMPRVTNKYMEKTLPDWGGYLLYLMPEAVFRPFLQAPVVDNSLISDELLHEFHQMYRGKGNRMAEYRRMQGWEKGDATPYLEKITAPTLVMWGQDNPQLPVEHVGQYKGKLVNAARVEQQIYPGIGHVIPLELPHQSALDARAFLVRD